MPDESFYRCEGIYTSTKLVKEAFYASLGAMARPRVLFHCRIEKDLTPLFYLPELSVGAEETKQLVRLNGTQVVKPAFSIFKTACNAWTWSPGPLRQCCFICTQGSYSAFTQSGGPGQKG
jgi:hypothetical protein